MKRFPFIGKINAGLGIVFFLFGIFLLIEELNEGSSLKDFLLSISFILIGITIFLAASFYKGK